jgi:hypothetical protein
VPGYPDEFPPIDVVTVLATLDELLPSNDWELALELPAIKVAEAMLLDVPALSFGVVAQGVEAGVEVGVAEGDTHVVVGVGDMDAGMSEAAYVLLVTVEVDPGVIVGVDVLLLVEEPVEIKTGVGAGAAAFHEVDAGVGVGVDVEEDVVSDEAAGVATGGPWPLFEIGAHCSETAMSARTVSTFTLCIRGHNKVCEHSL